MRTFRVGGVVIVGLTCAAVALAGCSSSTGGQPTTAAVTTGGITPTATAPTAPISTAATSTPATSTPPISTAATSTAVSAGTFDLGHGLVVETPPGTSATAFENSDYGNCTGVEATVTTAAGEYQLWLVGTDCADAAQRALNGNHGRYLTPPTEAEDVTASATVPTGTLVTFHQLYTECTNSCDDYHDAIGLITLSKPADPDLPVLMIVAPKDVDGDLSTVSELAGQITAG